MGVVGVEKLETVTSWDGGPFLINIQIFRPFLKREKSFRFLFAFSYSFVKFYAIVVAGIEFGTFSIVGEGHNHST